MAANLGMSRSHSEAVRWDLDIRALVDDLKPLARRKSRNLL